MAPRLARWVLVAATLTGCVAVDLSAEFKPEAATQTEGVALRPLASTPLRTGEGGMWLPNTDGAYPRLCTTAGACFDPASATTGITPQARGGFGADVSTGTANSATVTLTNKVADGASASAWVLNNSTSLANASASLVDVQNAGSTKFRVLASGNLTTNGTAAVSGTCTSCNVTVTNGLITAVASGSSAFTPIVTKLIAGSGTATKSSGATIVCAQVVGGGGGGGSGSKWPSNQSSGGQGGGGGGYVGWRCFKWSDLGNSVVYAVGAGGAGGAAVSNNSTNGNVGTGGGNTTLGSAPQLMIGGGGSGGGGGLNQASQCGAGVSGSGWWSGGAGACGRTTSTAGGAGGNSSMGATGGGGGSGDNGGAPPSGGNGGGNLGTVGLGGGAAGGIGTCGDGAAGSTVSAGYPSGYGGGGGKGCSTAATNGGTGGAGGDAGGGGGGGGGKDQSSAGNSGAGGAGADGAVWLIEY